MVGFFFCWLGRFLGLVALIIHWRNHPLPTLFGPCILASPQLFCQVPLIIWFSIPLHLCSFYILSPVFFFFLFFLYRHSYWGLLKLQLLRHVKHNLSIWKPHISLLQFTQYNILNFCIKVFKKLRKISASVIYRKEENEKKKEVNVTFQFLELCNCHNFSSQQSWDSCSAKTRHSSKL